MASTSVTLGPHWDEFIALMLKEGPVLLFLDQIKREARSRSGASDA